MSAALPAPGHHATIPDGGDAHAAPTTIRNICAGLVSTPLFAVPPSSCSRTDTTAVPVRPGAAVNVSVPADVTPGWTENSALLLFVTRKFSTCPDSFAGPAENPVAQLVTVCVPASTGTLWSGPLVKKGTS